MDFFGKVYQKRQEYTRAIEQYAGVLTDYPDMIARTNVQIFGASGYSRELPLERMARDVRMFTIGGGTAQVLRTLVASKMLGWKLPQTRDGYARKPPIRDAAE